MVETCCRLMLRMVIGIQGLRTTSSNFRSDILIRILLNKRLRLQEEFKALFTRCLYKCCC